MAWVIPWPLPRSHMSRPEDPAVWSKNSLLFVLDDFCFRQFLVRCIWWFIPCTEIVSIRLWHLHGKLPSEWQDRYKHQQKPTKTHQKPTKTIKTPQHPTRTDQNKQKNIKSKKNPQNPSNNIKKPISIHQPYVTIGFFCSSGGTKSRVENVNVFQVFQSRDLEWCRHRKLKQKTGVKLAMGSVNGWVLSTWKPESFRNYDQVVWRGNQIWRKKQPQNFRHQNRPWVVIIFRSAA